MQLQWILLTMILVGGPSCLNQDTDTGHEAVEKRYFDVKGFVRHEISRHTQTQTTVRKAVTINGETEVHEFSGMDFSKELENFTDADINRPAWSDKYGVDSLFSGDSLLVGLAYSARDPKLKTRSIRITFSEGEVVSIEVEKSVHSTIADMDQRLTYVRDKGYKVLSKQKIILSGTNDIEVEAIFLPVQ